MKVCLVAIFLVGLFTACAAEDDPTVSLPGVTDLSTPRRLPSIAMHAAPVCLLTGCIYCFVFRKQQCQRQPSKCAPLRRSAAIRARSDRYIYICLAAPENFDGLVNGRRHALVEFYAPWCGHCKRMTPEFKKVRPPPLQTLPSLPTSLCANTEIRYIYT